MDKIAVLIPCYNEEVTIEKVVRDAREALPEATIYVYNNNSTDRTAEIAAKAGAIVRTEHRQGKGNVIRRMFREIDAECYLMVDGDDTYSLDNAREMVSHILDGNADMVVGDRLSSTYFTENKRRFHNFGNKLVRSSINRLFNCDIRDIMTGYRAFNYDFVKTYPVLSSGFEIETEMTIHAVSHHMQIDNVPTDYRDRPEGSTSKLNTYSDGARVLRTIARMYRGYRPGVFFTILFFILLILAVIFFIPVFSAYLKTGEVRRFPTLIMCGFSGIAALQSLFTGLLLSGQTKDSSRQFEILRNIVHRQGQALMENKESGRPPKPDERTDS